MGLVFSVADDPMAEILSYLEQHVLPKSAVALQFAVRASRYQMYRAFASQIDELEAMYVNDLMESADANEGIQSFLEKRKPVWRNR